MSHEVDTMVSYRNIIPWHGLGNVFDVPPTSWEQFRVDAGLTWEPTEAPMYRRVRIGDEVMYDVVDRFKLVERSDTGYVLSPTNRKYPLITHEMMGQVMDKLMTGQNDHREAVAFETGGSLRNGEMVFAVARLGDPLELKGDPSPINRYMTLVNDHTASGAFKAMGNTIRVVCANTANAAEVEATASNCTFVFRHTTNWEAQVDKALDAVNGTYRDMDKFVETARRMLSLKLTEQDMTDLVNEFAMEVTLDSINLKRPDLAEYLATSKRVEASLRTTKDALIAIRNSETCEGLDRTPWLFFNMVTQQRGARPSKGDSSRFSRSMIEVDKFKKMAFQMAMAKATTNA